MSTSPQQLGNEPQRNDPELLQKVSAALDAQNKAAREALELLRKAEKALQRVASFDDERRYDRVSNNVFSAKSVIEKNLAFKPTQIYLGNMAMSTMGNRILAMDEDQFEKIIDRVRGEND